MRGADYLFQLHPVSTVYAGPMLWHLDVAADVLRWYNEFQPNAPDELTGNFVFMSVAPEAPFPETLWNQTMCAIVWCYAGPLEEAEDVLLPVRTRISRPALDWVGPTPFPVLQGTFDGVFPAGNRMYWKGDFVNEFSDASITLHIQQALRKPVGPSMIGYHPIDGTAGRIAANATPWAYRDAKWAGAIVGVTQDAAEDDAAIAWVRETWDVLHPHSAGGSYVNFMGEEGAQRIQATYRGNYTRLARIKAQYDPDNLFRVNQNIPPVPSGR